MNKIKICLLIFCSTFFILPFVHSVSAQSGNPVKNVPAKPVQGTPSQSDDVAKTRIPLSSVRYVYLEPKVLSEFLVSMKDAGKRGFKTKKVATSLVTQEEAEKPVLAGIAEFIGDAQYDYDFFFAENEKDPEKTLNSMRENGWRFLDNIIVPGKLDGNKIKTSRLNTVVNVYLLEKKIGDETPVPEYKLLKSGTGLGRNPVEKMQSLLDAEIINNFAPIAVYQSASAKNILSIDVALCVILQKSETAQAFSYNFLNARQAKGLRNDIEDASKQGYRLLTQDYNTAIVIKPKEQTAPKNIYNWVDTNDKSYSTALSAVLAKNPIYVSTFFKDDFFTKSVLMFDENPAQQKFFDYQLVKVSPIVPKQFKKNPQDYLKTIESPSVAFERLSKDGYVARDIFYSYIDGYAVLFERQKR